jgi:AcrR family transcriptional regulator
MSKRSYVSAVRSDAATEKRERVIESATQFLRDEQSIANFSLEAIAKAAGTTRLTVYNQFGSRRGLLEAIFENISRKGRISRLSEASALPDPHTGLNEVVGIFCEFWSSDSAIGPLYDAIAIDPEIAQALSERIELGREAIAQLIGRMANDKIDVSIRCDVVDLIFALTSYAMFRMLVPNRSVLKICELIKTACDDAIERMLSQAIRKHAIESPPEAPAYNRKLPMNRE